MYPKRRKGGDKGPDLALGNSLQVIAIDCTLPGHSVRLVQQHFARNVAC